MTSRVEDSNGSGEPLEIAVSRHKLNPHRGVHIGSRFNQHILNCTASESQAMHCIVAYDKL